MADQLHRIMSGEAGGPLSAAARLGLAGLSFGYGAAVAVRNRSFDRGWRKARRLDRPVVSVGNITAGGVGKTPMVLEICRRLMVRGVRPAVLTRGYGGDEPVELADALGKLADGLAGMPTQQAPPVCVGADRYRAAREALAGDVAIDVFVMDDGFQRRQLARDLDIVLLDATNLFGFDRLLPRGLLREPVAALGRADVVILTRCDMVDRPTLEAVEARAVEAARLGGGQPGIIRSRFVWAGYRCFQPEQLRDSDEPADALADVRIAAVCGVGNPRAFESQLRANVGEAAAVVSLADHQNYARQAERIISLASSAAEQGAGAVVTTEKDFVKWRSQPWLARLALPVYRPVLKVVFDGDGGRLLDELLAPASTASSQATGNRRAGIMASIAGDRRRGASRGEH